MKWRRAELTYCSNVHPGTSLADVEGNVSRWVSSVAKQRELQSMAAGLWFSMPCCDELYANEALRSRFYQHLQDHQLYLGTLNGFPFGDFHQEVVKASVYRPTWADQARFDYTLKLAHLCAAAPASEGCAAEISISTLPLGYASEWSDDLHLQACRQLCLLADRLRQLKQETGRHVRVCLEMEPDCVLEKTDQLIAFFQKDLTKTAKDIDVSESTVFDFLGCCFDVCHQAVMHEDCFESMRSISDAGIAVGKIQVSSAPKLNITKKDDVEFLCSEFSEPKFLHQVKVKLDDGSLFSFSDLSDVALNKLTHEEMTQLYGRSWRLHFHVPIHLQSLSASDESAGTVLTTQSDILDVLRFISAHSSKLLVKPSLEIETYTWPQFKHDTQFDLAAGIVSELSWLEIELKALGLLLD